MTVQERTRQIATDTRRYEIDALTGCWNWKGAKLRSGHGVVKVCRKGKMAYRIFFAFFIGTIAVGLQLHHKCQNPTCVNPQHLIALTPGEHARLHAKLSYSKASEIRQLYRTGKSQQEIAELFGVDQTTVSAVLTQRTWREPIVLPELQAA